MNKTIGRPTKYQGLNCAIVRKLTDAFKSDFTVREACYYAGIAKSTYYKWLDEFDEFSDEMERSQMFLVVEAKKRLKTSVLQTNDFNKLFAFLERRDPSRYRKNRPIEQGENEGARVVLHLPDNGFTTPIPKNRN